MASRSLWQPCFHTTYAPWMTYSTRVVLYPHTHHHLSSSHPELFLNLSPAQTSKPVTWITPLLTQLQPQHPLCAVIPSPPQNPSDNLALSYMGLYSSWLLSFPSLKTSSYPVSGSRQETTTSPFSEHPQRIKHKSSVIGGWLRPSTLSSLPLTNLLSEWQPRRSLLRQSDTCCLRKPVTDVGTSEAKGLFVPEPLSEKLLLV